MKKKQHRKKYKNLYILEKSLEQILEQRIDKKEIAYNIDQDYSNFSKMCRLSTNPTIGSYVDCAQAFDLDVLIIHLPKGLIENSVMVQPNPSDRFKLLSSSDLITLVNKMGLINRQKIEQQLLFILSQELKQESSIRMWLRRLCFCLTKLLNRHGGS